MRHLFLLWGITISMIATAQDHAIFSAIEKGESDRVQYLIKQDSSLINIVNQAGYPPLHVLIDFFVDYNPELALKDQAKGKQNLALHEKYAKCLRLLLDHNVDLNFVNPMGWNALQYAVIKGKFTPAEKILIKGKGGKLVDKAGNTLLHLSALTKNTELRKDFWELLIDRLRPYNITRNTLNALGQTPVTLFMSVPQKYSLLSLRIYQALRTPESVYIKDHSGNTLSSYIESRNKEFSFEHSLYLQTVKFANQELAKFERVRKENTRRTEEYLRQLEEEAEGELGLQESFTVRVLSACETDASGKRRFQSLSEPITISVTPASINISNLAPYYGSFKVASSGYETVNGTQFEVYRLKNSTYQAIGFSKGDRRVVIVKTSVNVESYCN
jgi:ankyrin repeat protein